MRYLKKYENHKDIYNICKRYHIKNFSINDNGSIDVHDDVRFFMSGLNEIPLIINRVNGYYTLQHNHLTSLENCPKWVGGTFICSNNNLTSLKDCPKWVGGHFYCSNNEIDTFDGLSFVNIVGEFYCTDNPIDSIWRLFKDHTKFEFFNDCDPIREDRTIILDRLNFFLDYIGRGTVTEVEGYKCI